VVTPPRKKSVQSWQYEGDNNFDKAQEMGRFNMGSTVILLFSKDCIKWNSKLVANTPVQMGQLLAQLK